MNQRGIDVVLKINDIPVAGQTNATLTQMMKPIEITNKVYGEWSEYLTGIKSWKILGSGMYVLNSSSFDMLEDAFMNNKEIDVSVTLGDKKYIGHGLITDYPLNSIYNAQFKYSVSILGTGPLLVVN